MELRNEFADVLLEVDWSANGPRLAIRDRNSNAVRLLDPLQLEALVWADTDKLIDLFVDAHRRKCDSAEDPPP